MTTVRIQGSRAREQMPGTSITLLAPGFRGALTQQAAGVASGTDYDLPFGTAATGAEVALASQLTLNLEARTDMCGVGLRSRSALVAHPRVIVPRRSDLAYAMLQTDETGTSSFVLPASADETEAAFPLTIAAQGTTRRVLRVLTWPIHAVLTAGAPALAARWERLRRPNQLAQYTGNGQWLAPDWRSLCDGPVLLLLHDTFSTPQATFSDWIGDESFAPVHRQYAGRCLAFTHPTLATGIEENLAWVVAHLSQLPGPIDIVAHGRGGLLARAIAADGRLPLRRACLVGTPNKGTALARYGSLSRFLNGHVAMLARTSTSVARSTLEGVLCMLRFVALGIASPLPGIESIQQGSASRDLPGEWFTVGAEFAMRGGHPDAALEHFAFIPNDLVVPSDGCHDPGVDVADSLRLVGESVHHHNYFTNDEVRERLARWLCV
jgi:pimeloyl-ACP methyl ester carboxylesterase